MQCQSQMPSAEEDQHSECISHQQVTYPAQTQRLRGFNRGTEKQQKNYRDRCVDQVKGKNIASK